MTLTTKLLSWFLLAILLTPLINTAMADEHQAERPLSDQGETTGSVICG